VTLLGDRAQCCTGSELSREDKGPEQVLKMPMTPRSESEPLPASMGIRLQLGAVMRAPGPLVLDGPLLPSASGSVWAKQTRARGAGNRRLVLTTAAAASSYAHGWQECPYGVRFRQVAGLRLVHSSVRARVLPRTAGRRF